MRNSGEGWWGWAEVLFPLATGTLIAASFLDFRLYPLAWVAFVPLLLGLYRCHSRRQALVAGCLAGLATNVPAFSWLVHTIHVFGGFPLPLAVFFYFCLSVFAALEFVLFAWGVYRLGPGPLCLSAPLIWVALEFLYPNLFPWRMANSQMRLPVLLQVGDVTGPYGLSFVLVWFSAALAGVWRQPRRPLQLLAAAAAAALVVLYGEWRMPQIDAAIAAAPIVRVGLVQGNVSVVEKGDAAMFQINEERYRELSEALEPGTDLLVWPESVSQHWVLSDARLLPLDFNPYPDLRSYLVYGGLAFTRLGPGRFRQYNSAFLIGADGVVLGRYDKHVLLPFGEYLPGASWFPALQRLSPRTGRFSAGRRIVTLDVPGRVRLAPLICYEDVPAGMARAMTVHGAEALLTLFNDAWFGDSVAPYQHEALALWRAIENRRFFLRVGNAGATSVIDPFGRVTKRLGLFQEGTLRAEIRPLRLITFYTRHGDVFAWSVVFAVVVWLIANGWRRGGKRRIHEAV